MRKPQVSALVVRGLEYIVPRVDESFDKDRDLVYDFHSREIDAAMVFLDKLIKWHQHVSRRIGHRHES